MKNLHNIHRSCENANTFSISALSGVLLLLTLCMLSVLEKDLGLDFSVHLDLTNGAVIFLWGSLVRCFEWHRITINFLQWTVKKHLPIYRRRKQQITKEPNLASTAQNRSSNDLRPTQSSMRQRKWSGGRGHIRQELNHQQLVRKQNLNDNFPPAIIIYYGKHIILWAWQVQSAWKLNHLKPRDPHIV